MKKLTFLRSPWEELAEHTAISLQKELHKELGPQHPLYGAAAVAVARRDDNDDVLFWIGELEKYAVVHLTWSSTNIAPYPKTLLLTLGELREHCGEVSEED